MEGYTYCLQNAIKIKVIEKFEILMFKFFGFVFVLENQSYFAERL